MSLPNPASSGDLPQERVASIDDLAFRLRNQGFFSEEQPYPLSARQHRQRALEHAAQASLVDSFAKASLLADVISPEHLFSAFSRQIVRLDDRQESHLPPNSCRVDPAKVRRLMRDLSPSWPVAPFVPAIALLPEVRRPQRQPRKAREALPKAAPPLAQSDTAVAAAEALPGDQAQQQVRRQRAMFSAVCSHWIRHHQPVPFSMLVTHPRSLTQSVENLFDLAYLTKDRRLEKLLVLDDRDQEAAYRALGVDPAAVLAHRYLPDPVYRDARNPGLYPCRLDEMFVQPYPSIMAHCDTVAAQGRDALPASVIDAVFAPLSSEKETSAPLRRQIDTMDAFKWRQMRSVFALDFIRSDGALDDALAADRQPRAREALQRAQSHPFELPDFPVSAGASLLSPFGGERDYSALAAADEAWEQDTPLEGL
jgi:hypothetical protein